MIFAWLMRVLRFAPEDYERRQPYKPHHVAIGCTLCGRCVVCGDDHEPKVQA